MGENRKKPEPSVPALVFFKYLTRLSMSLVICSAFVVTLSSLGFADSLKRTVFEVNNIHCGYCLSKINSVLAGLDGFVGMSADLSQGKMVVDHRAALSAAAISKAITASGYPARISEDPSAEQDIRVVEKPGGQDKWYSKRVGCRGCATSYSCGGSASTWHEFYSKYFGKDR